jgi:3-oxoacyl-[acyl-carrier-protein] synthase III
MKSPLPLRIAGTGIAVPGAELSAAALDARLSLAAGESERITGIAKRHTATDETASQLGAAAVRAALADAGMAWGEVDALICASATMDQALPYNAAMILAELPEARTHRVAALDVGASCLSFLQALDLASCALAAGRYGTIVIVSSDISTYTTDYRDLRSNGIFGDGAAAAVVRRSSEDGGSAVLASRSVTLPEGIEYCRIRSGGSRFHRRGFPEHGDALFEMNGRPLFALVARELPEFVEGLLAEAGVTKVEINFLVPHQASRQALDHVAKMLGFDDGRMVDVFSQYGNQVAASLPTALHFAIHQHGLKRGGKVLLLGSGAGVTIGGIVLVY